MREVKDYLPYPERYPAGYKEILAQIKEKIYGKLKDFPNFDGISFTDVSGGYVIIDGYHKSIERYVFGGSKLQYNMTDAEEAVQSFVDFWIHLDNGEHLKWYQEFLSEGEKYGWD